jgi:hypothetical protein
MTDALVLKHPGHPDQEGHGSRGASKPAKSPLGRLLKSTVATLRKRRKKELTVESSNRLKALVDEMNTKVGFQGHRGRPGKRGGSLPRSGGGGSALRGAAHVAESLGLVHPLVSGYRAAGWPNKKTWRGTTVRHGDIQALAKKVGAPARAAMKVAGRAAWAAGKPSRKIAGALARGYRSGKVKRVIGTAARTGFALSHPAAYLGARLIAGSIARRKKRAKKG